jgi:molybdopterin/thiamine biosynthesis adenylyltransferase
MLLKEIGPRGQKRLLAGKVLIIGAGGLGAPAAMYLAAAGVGTLGLVDADSVDLSNLQRQIIHGTGDVGRAKVESARRTIADLNPDVEVVAFEGRAEAANIMDLVAGWDFVLDGTDNFPAKFLINDACVLSGKPFSHAGIIRFQGQLITWLPGQGPCYRCLFPAPPPPGAVPTCRQAGIIGAMAGVIGSLQAMEAVKFLTGAGRPLTGALMTYDALAMEFRKIPVSRRPSCPVCGESPTIKAPADLEPAACDLRP